MKQYLKSIRTAVVCFLLVVVLNFLLPRWLPGDPVAYLTGFAEEELTAVQRESYEAALHLNEPLWRQFLWYLGTLLDGTLGYSCQKQQVVSALIGQRLGYTLQITLPGVVLSTVLGLVLGLNCGYPPKSGADRVLSVSLILLNAVPAFVIGLVLMIVFCFRWRLFPYTGLSTAGILSGTAGFLADRVWHLVLPVLTLTLATLPSRFLLMRNTTRKIAGEKFVLYARQRGLSRRTIQYRYLLPQMIQPFLTMVGMSVSVCIGGSLVIENLFSIPGMGSLLTDAVYTLDYPLMQGILFVATVMMVLSIVVTDLICLLLDPRLRLGGDAE